MDKTQKNITAMFNEIAPTYDRANRIMSLGMDRTWRRRACDLALRRF
ncbi:class I SAM-dependent methyltransferase [Myxococcota bacterium]|nr:class I SAM-dependent methyltransferase [Myxococcota bacterium]